MLYLHTLHLNIEDNDTFRTLTLIIAGYKQASSALEIVIN